MTIMKTVLKFLVCAGSIFVAKSLFPDLVTIDGGVATYLVAGLILWLVNIFIKPIAHLISIPFTLLTLGLFILVVNAAMVALADLIIPSVSFANFWTCLFIAIINSALNLVLLPKKA